MTLPRESRTSLLTSVNLVCRRVSQRLRVSISLRGMIRVRVVLACRLARTKPRNRPIGVRVVSGGCRRGERLRPKGQRSRVRVVSVLCRLVSQHPTTRRPRGMNRAPALLNSRRGGRVRQRARRLRGMVPRSTVSRLRRPRRRTKHRSARLSTPRINRRSRLRVHSLRPHRRMVRRRPSRPMVRLPRLRMPRRPPSRHTAPRLPSSLMVMAKAHRPPKLRRRFRLRRDCRCRCHGTRLRFPGPRNTRSKVCWRIRRPRATPRPFWKSCCVPGRIYQ